MRCQRHNRGYRKGIGRVRPTGCLALSGWVCVYTPRARYHSAETYHGTRYHAVAYSRGHAESPGFVLLLAIRLPARGGGTRARAPPQRAPPPPCARPMPKKQGGSVAWGSELHSAWSALDSRARPGLLFDRALGPGAAVSRRHHRTLRRLLVGG